MVSPFVRTVKDGVGGDGGADRLLVAGRGSRDSEHIGSAHDDGELEVLKAVARQRLAAGTLRAGDASSGDLVGANAVAEVKLKRAR